jgi:predicted PurR-regulated permease PerM
VLLATALGGVLGGVIGLILAVPVTVLLIDLARRVRVLRSVETAPPGVPSPG